MKLDMNANQLDHLYTHLTSVGNITRREADSLYRIQSLSRRINDLEERGVNIMRDNRVDATGARYTRYFYAGELA